MLLVGGGGTERHPTFGRPSEFAAIVSFLEHVASGPSILMLEGEPGVGKTTLWYEALVKSKACAEHTLAARPAQTEAKLPYAGLGDLLEPVVDEVLDDIPPAHARALEIALVRRDAPPTPSDRRTVAVATLSALRRLADPDPVVIGIDDVQWLDRPSANVLGFAIRRLGTEPVGVVSSLRIEPGSADPLDLDHAAPDVPTTHLRVGPLGIADLGKMVADQLGLELDHSQLVSLHRTSGGNPLFALEIARELVAGGGDVAPAGTVHIPGGLRAAVLRRVRKLPARTREALLSVAATSAPTEQLLRRALGLDAEVALEPAYEKRIIERSGDRVRFTHPLLASAVYEDAPSIGRRRVHTRLAEVADDPAERARHLALATLGPDPTVAQELDEAARIANLRGAPEDALELGQLAIEMTPADDADAKDRREIEAANIRVILGDWRSARAVLESIVASAPSGPTRASALMSLGTILGYFESWIEAREVLLQAREEAGNDAALMAGIEQTLMVAFVTGGDLPMAAECASAELEHARAAGHPTLVANALGHCACGDFLLGRGVDEDRLRRAAELEGWTEHLPSLMRPSLWVGALRMWSDDLGGARGPIEALWNRLMELGLQAWLPLIAFYPAELECWAGNLEAADRYASIGLEVARENGGPSDICAGLYARALVDAYLGRVEEARGALEEGTIIAGQVGNSWVAMQLLAIRGFLALSLGDFAGTDAALGDLARIMTAMGLADPGVVHFLPDQIEALVGLGRLQEAKQLIDLLEERSQAVGRVWGLATAARCRALLHATIGDVTGALGAVEVALAHHEKLPYPLELGRTLLVKGGIERRARRWRLARESLEQAREIFDGIGTRLWATRAERELLRISGRRASSDLLTPSEERVAALAAEGKTNREIAQALYLTVKTVEAHLSRIYSKLGVRSRTELSVRLSTARGGPGGEPS